MHDIAVKYEIKNLLLKCVTSLDGNESEWCFHARFRRRKNNQFIDCIIQCMAISLWLAPIIGINKFLFWTNQQNRQIEVHDSHRVSSVY